MWSGYRTRRWPVGTKGSARRWLLRGLLFRRGELPSISRRRTCPRRATDNEEYQRLVLSHPRQPFHCIPKCIFDIVPPILAAAPAHGNRTTDADGNRTTDTGGGWSA